ncbi:MAG: NAD(P)-dependent alcohol dehydrogenase [Saprospiraceae bacterium]|nr:NAD(P)-dependent alcohol dehydrogenase [Saprospiraceae bacterium]
MRAVIYERYGSPEVLELKDISKPLPKENEVLIKIHSTTVSAGDWRMRKADPFLARLFNGLVKPKRVKILGFELSGVIEEVGGKVITFSPGDHVFASCGLRFGGYAEYTVLPVNDLIAIKPSNMTFEEAATVPVGGLTALRFLKQADLKKGDNVLIYGASGSVGTFGVQIAKSYGANITAVCSTDNVNLVTQLGAQTIIDYTKDDYTKAETRYNIIFDAVGKTTKSVCKPLLKSGGKYISVTSSPKASPQDLQELKALIESGKGKLITVTEQKVDRLDQIREAHAYVESFRKKGNVVINIYGLDAGS